MNDLRYWLFRLVRPGNCWLNKSGHNFSLPLARRWTIDAVVRVPYSTEKSSSQPVESHAFRFNIAYGLPLFVILGTVQISYAKRNSGCIQVCCVVRLTDRTRTFSDWSKRRLLHSSWSSRVWTLLRNANAYCHGSCMHTTLTCSSQLILLATGTTKQFEPLSARFILFFLGSAVELFFGPLISAHVSVCCLYAHCVRNYRFSWPISGLNFTLLPWRPWKS